VMSILFFNGGRTKNSSKRYKICKELIANPQK
jgi:hypothetical protein